MMMRTALLTILLITASTPVYADGIKDAAILAIDKTLCGFNVPQTLIDSSIVQGMREYGINYDQAILAAGYVGQDLENRIIAKNVPTQYCEARRQTWINMLQ